MTDAEKGLEDSNPDSIGGLLEHLLETTEGEQQLSIGHLLESLESRSHGPMLLIPALIAVSPLGMIPGMSVITGSLIILIAFQLIFFSSRPWIPSKLESVKFQREKLETAVSRFGPWVDRFERLTGHRLEVLTTGGMLIPIAVTCMLLAITFYPLALIPFGVVVPGIAICCFALGITSRDGLLVLFGFLGTGFAAYWVLQAWPF